MGVIIWIIVGIICGVVATVVPSRNRHMVINILAGIFGAVAAGFITNLVMRFPVQDFNLINLLISIIGAGMILAIVYAMRTNE